jgi:undecaprenyl diphosphate synthase
MAVPKLETLPTHVAIIMDGNGRWARKRHLPRQAGHVAGVAAVREVVRAACDIGLKHLTMYAFSSENWKRPATEVGALMGLFRTYFKNDLNDLIARNVRIRIIGNRARADNDILGMIEEAEQRSEKNTGLNLTFAFDYGSQEEITLAARKLAQAVKDGTLDPQAITPELFEQQLFTGTTPPPDLVIRTSGEHRMSNFLLWQSAYAELLFVETLWPDFGREKFIAALQEFSQRERRFGALDSEAVA